METTVLEYDSIIKKCEDIFAKKMKDYGSAWRILRISSLTDQIFIKAQRIRSIESKGTQKIDEGVINEFIGIVNYSVIGLIQIDLGVSEQPEDLNYDVVINMFRKHVLSSKDLMVNKNHDYGEAWRDMRVSSLTDLILQKLLRVKQIEDNDQIALHYSNDKGEINEKFNPNGSLKNIAGIFNKKKNVLGMMPHPERVFRKLQMSWKPNHWKEFSPWMQIFINARKFSE